MRVRRFARLGLGIVGAVVVFACNALTGVGDLAIELPDAGDGGKGLVEAEALLPTEAGAAPTCGAGGRCVSAAIPGGFSGPAMVYDGNESALPPCPSGTASVLDGLRGPPEAPFSCAPCACGALEQVSCSASARTYTDMGCNTFLREDPLTAACVAADANARGLTVTTRATGGLCKSSGGEATKSPVTWPGVIRACATRPLTPGTCAAGEVCVANPAPAFEPQHCIVHDGDVACPDPWSARRLVYAGADDTRACTSTCGCEAPVNATCEGTGSYHGNVDCAGVASTASVPTNACVTLTPPASARLGTASPLRITKGSCPVKGTSTPAGAAVPTGARTLCCLAP